MPRVLSAPAPVTSRGLAWRGRVVWALQIKVLHGPARFVDEYRAALAVVAFD